jgi:hypothetical protein
VANVTRNTGTSFSRILPVEIWRAVGAGQHRAKEDSSVGKRETHIDATDIQDSAVRYEPLLQVLLHRSPQHVVCLERHELIPQFPCQLPLILLDKPPIGPRLTASPHHIFKLSLSAFKYASTTSGTIYSLNSR